MRRPAELRFDREGFLAWMVGLMVFLAALATASALAAHGAAERWARGLAGTVTIQVPAASAERLDALVTALRRAAGVRSVAVLGGKETAALLEPWLGPGAHLEDLPLPRLVDLRVAPRTDMEALRKIAAETAEGAVLDDHRRWVDRLAGFATAVEIAAVLVVLLVAGTAALTVVFAARAGLAAQRAVVELLHLVGARDGWIARHVERQALLLALKGGTGGLAAAIAVLGILYWMAMGDDLKLLPQVRRADLVWLALLCLPLAAGLVAMATARITVLRALRRLP